MKIVPFEKPLKLKNEGYLELAFFGVGTAFSTKLYNNNFILIKGDTHILVDFGMTGPIALEKNTGLSATDIEVMLPTHSHTDHIGGLEYLALYKRYLASHLGGSSLLRMIIAEDYENVLWKMSLRGGMEWNETSASGKRMSFVDYFDPVRPSLLSKEPRLVLEIDFEGIHLELFGTNHIPDNAETQGEAFFSYGLFVDNRLFISGDTKFDLDLFKRYADRSEVMFHDASFARNPVHASLEELRTLPAHIKKKMYLMHYGDESSLEDIPEFLGMAETGVTYIFD
jgi:hydroxyacylglutathione hydrolase